LGECAEVTKIVADYALSLAWYQNQSVQGEDCVLELHHAREPGNEASNPTEE